MSHKYHLYFKQYFYSIFRVCVCVVVRWISLCYNCVLFTRPLPPCMARLTSQKPKPSKSNNNSKTGHLEIWNWILCQENVKSPKYHVVKPRSAYLRQLLFGNEISVMRDDDDIGCVDMLNWRKHLHWKKSTCMIYNDVTHLCWWWRVDMSGGQGQLP